MNDELKASKHKKSTNIRLILLAFVILAILAAFFIIANLNQAEVTVWAPGPNYGYETPNDKV